MNIFLLCIFLSLSAQGVHTHPLFLFPFSLSLVYFSFLYDTIILLHSIPDNQMFAVLSSEYTRKAQSCPLRNYNYKKTARIIFWRPNGYEAISALFPFFHYDKTGFLQALRQRWFVLDCPFSFALCTILLVYRSCYFVHILQYITIYHLISRKRPENTSQIGCRRSPDLSWRHSSRCLSSGLVAEHSAKFRRLMLIFS